MVWFRRRRPSGVDAKSRASMQQTAKASTNDSSDILESDKALAWVSPEAQKMKSVAGGGRKSAPNTSDTPREPAEGVRRLREATGNRNEPRFDVHSKKFGHGAYGAVHVGTIHTHNGPREVAIKVIPESRTRLEALAREAAIMERLSQSNHPSVLRFYGWLSPGSPEVRTMYGADAVANLSTSHCLIMEAATGGELFEYVSEHRGLHEREAGALMAQICEAVGVAHSLGIAHRDLKLENVLFSKDSTGHHRVLKLIDWGLAHQHDIDSNGNVVPELLHSRCGSKSYMAPEVICCSSRSQRQGNTVGFDSFKADIWSLGICFFAMLFGFFPFEQSDTSKDWRAERCRESERAGGSVVATIMGFYPNKGGDVSPDAKKLLDSMLCFDPSRRASLADVLASQFLFTHVARTRRILRTADFHLPLPTGAEEFDSCSTHSSSLNGESDLSASGSDRVVPRGAIHSGRRSSDYIRPSPSVALKPQHANRVSRQGTSDTDVSLSSVGSSVKRSVVRLTNMRPEQSRENALAWAALPPVPAPAAPLPPHRPFRCTPHAGLFSDN